MSKVDQFESVFRAAIHDVYEHKNIPLSTILIISDLEGTTKNDFENKIKAFSKHIDLEGTDRWLSLSKGDYKSSQELIKRIEEFQPDLIFTYRNLQSSDWQYSLSLGEDLDVLIQKTTVPVVVLPHPLDKDIYKHALKNTNCVMAITDHLSSDDDLVNYAVQFTEPEGKLYLVHIEDANTFDYYMDTISKISEIDTDDARLSISKQLLKAPNDYIHSVKAHLQQENLAINVEKIVGFGHHLTEYQNYIKQYQVDLLVMNTQDKEQMAMHGLAYPLVVELRSIPLLLI
ncbi:MAG: hypothetical protein ACC653_11335 [Gammaproteobacteria bacterium]